MSQILDIPAHIETNSQLFGRFKVALSEALSACIDESEWKKFATRYDLRARIINHRRFLRSLDWGDPDHEGLVLELVEDLCQHNRPALLDLFQRPAVQELLRRDAGELMDILERKADPVIRALSHSFAQLNAAKDVVDLELYSKRVDDALPSDPNQAIGATKELLEAAMLSILNKKGMTDVQRLNFVSLTDRCFEELGLSERIAPASESERHVRKIYSNAKKMVGTANELRNLAGTGHGRIVGREEHLSSEDARLVASIGLILAAWLLRRAEGS